MLIINKQKLELRSFLRPEIRCMTISSVGLHYLYDSKLSIFPLPTLSFWTFTTNCWVLPNRLSNLSYHCTFWEYFQLPFLVILKYSATLIWTRIGLSQITYPDIRQSKNSKNLPPFSTNCVNLWKLKMLEETNRLKTKLYFTSLTAFPVKSLFSTKHSAQVAIYYFYINVLQSQISKYTL